MKITLTNDADLLSESFRRNISLEFRSKKGKYRLSHTIYISSGLILSIPMVYDLMDSSLPFPSMLVALFVGFSIGVLYLSLATIGAYKSALEKRVDKFRESQKLFSSAETWELTDDHFYVKRDSFEMKLDWQMFEHCSFEEDGCHLQLYSGGRISLFKFETSKEDYNAATQFISQKVEMRL